MIATLSIVIPTYNRECTTLVRPLQLQAENIDGLHYEVLVADDGSADSAVKQANRMIRDWDNCRLIELEQNIGRACIRNYLAREAKYPYLLFLDSDVQVVVPDYLSRYLRCKGDDVVYGGVCIVPNAELAAHNLRYRYELACEPRHSVERRKVSPYQGFRTSNFLMRRDVLLSHPFDERIGITAMRTCSLVAHYWPRAYPSSTLTTLWRLMTLNQTRHFSTKPMKACAHS